MIQKHRNSSLAYAPDRVLSGEKLFVFIEKLMQKYPVMGPRERSDQPGFYRFDWLEAPQNFVPDYTTTAIPPKKAFFPPDEILFRFELGSPPKLDIVQENFPFVLAGVHPCDLAAFETLDTAYLHPPAEVRWRENRKRAMIIGIDCMPDKYCFCTSLGTYGARFPCDLFLTKLDNDYLVEIFTRKGEELLIGLQTRSATDRDFQHAEQWRRQKLDAVSIRFNSTLDRLADILDKDELTDLWKETAQRCYSCGSCNTSCPTCFCFNMHDEFDLTLKSGIRHRTWDSCQLLEFALVAGGENMRGERWQRVRHRWHRKFLYLYRQFGFPYCTGCGRCSRACTADINIVDVTNRIIRVAKQEATSE
jgi:sulfhydrogenase subunit beta (sulfur reductase)